MKKYISAPLCSALVIPGLGQILNGDVKKGLTLLAAVFILLILGAVKLYLIMNAAFQGAAGKGLSAEAVLEQLRTSDFRGLWVLGALFLGIWAYAVADAVWRGWRIESRSGNGEA
jgi:TM2 domain-containing membrane protein YozV